MERVFSQNISSAQLYAKASEAVAYGNLGRSRQHQKDKTPTCLRRWGFRNLILTMTYSHMGKPHTTIGDASFHC